MHECLYYKDPVFLTLTYAGEEWDNASLVPAHLQQFWKRVRYYRGECFKFGPINDHDLNRPFKYFGAGEYGTKFNRPHWHAIVFGVGFSDRKFWKTLPSGYDVYRSAALEKMWPFGHSCIGSVSFESAQYCASYIVQKENGPQNDAYDSRYARCDKFTGEIYKVEPERGYMSLRPCIGKSFAEDFETELKRGFIRLPGGQSVPLPKLDNEVLKEKFSDVYLELQKERKEWCERTREDRTPERLRVREEVARSRSKLKRGEL